LPVTFYFFITALSNPSMCKLDSHLDWNLFSGCFNTKMKRILLGGKNHLTNMKRFHLVPSPCSIGEKDLKSFASRGYYHLVGLWKKNVKNINILLEFGSLRINHCYNVHCGYMASMCGVID
jgi:hypothetical protein